MFDPDRVVYSMVLGWIVLCAVLIVLDWMGNPNRGSFRPKGDRPLNDRRMRRVDRARRRLESDAAVRATLRDAYGASSMRLTWSGEHEDKARQLDDALVVRDLDERDDVLEVGSREVVDVDYTLAEGDPLPNIEELEPVATDETDEDDRPADEPAVLTDDSAIDEPVADDEDDTDDVDSDASDPSGDASSPERPRGWRVGGDPLNLTARGTEPNPTTVRNRVWKNHAALGAWDVENAERLKSGKPPRRHNPITGRDERGIVDADTGRATWGSEPVDPFAEAP